MYIKKSVAVIICCFAVAAIILSVGFTVKSENSTKQMKQAAAYSYQKSFAALSESLEKVSIDLKKCTYASTPYQQMVTASSVWKSVGEAKTALESLPTETLNLEKIPSFFNQSGEYVLSVAKRMINNGQMTDEERETLKKLSDTAQSLSQQMTVLQYRINSENLAYDDLLLYIQLNDIPTEGEIPTSLTENNEKFTSENPLLNMELGLDFDGLDYDGVYSSHLSKISSVFLENKEPITDEEARNRAAYILGCQPSDLTQSEDVTSGTVKCFSFSSDNADIIVTMRQGYPFTFVKNRKINDAVLEFDEAVEKGNEFLKKMKLAEMECVNYKTEDGLLIAEYVYVDDGVYCYPDSVKLAVALDNGEIFAADFSDYLMNHNVNRKNKPSVTEDEISALYGNEQNEIKLCVIESNGVDEREKLCYEVTQTDNGAEIRTFINALTGVEEKITLVYDTEQGKIYQ